LDRVDLIRKSGRRECDPTVQEVSEKRDVLDRDRLIESVLMVVDRPRATVPGRRVGGTIRRSA
jgi:hypothetical protein